jgi:putative peptide zinc metalloprotease protein
MAVICVISWGVVPLVRFIGYLASSPRLARTRPRAVAVTVGGALAVLFFLAICPFPNRFRAPGVLEAVTYIRLVNDAPGYVEAVLVPSDTEVAAGEPLMVLSDHELDLEIEATNAQLKETLAMERKAMHLDTAGLEPIHKRLETIEKKLQDLQKQHAALEVRARKKGTWVSRRDTEMVGTWIPRGSFVGEIVNRDAFRFSAVVPQDEASNLFVGQIRKVEVRLYGQGGENLEVRDYEIIPFQHEKLPSAALGWRGGGEVAVSLQDDTGLEATEPFFQIYANLESSKEVAFFHGCSGKIRFSMQPAPLLTQWIRKFRQLLQKRYQI